MSDDVGTPIAVDGRTLHVLQQVGSGGFGTVHLGRVVGASGFVKPVAIKILKGEAGDSEQFASRFRDEARLLARLRHQSIVQVDDLVQIDGRWAIVMEFIAGEDLHTLIGKGAAPERASAEVISRVASALHAAHTATDPLSGEPLNIVHRDIKPGNIRLTAAGEVKVLDFGIAKARFSEREAETQSVRFGSAGYVAPERMDGIDTPAADIFSLGAVWYALLTGRPLGKLSIRSERHALTVERKLTLLPEMNASLKDLLISCLNYEPSRRPTAREITRAIQEQLPHLSGAWLTDWTAAMIEVSDRVPEPVDEPAATVHVADPTLAELAAAELEETERADLTPTVREVDGVPIATERADQEPSSQGHQAETIDADTGDGATLVVNEADEGASPPNTSRWPFVFGALVAVALAALLFRGDPEPTASTATDDGTTAVAVATVSVDGEGVGTEADDAGSEGLAQPPEPEPVRESTSVPGADIGDHSAPAAVEDVATVVVRGKVRKWWLEGAETYSTGDLRRGASTTSQEVPVGRYTLRVEFHGDSSRLHRERITLSAGEELVRVCTSARGACHAPGERGQRKRKY